MWIPINISFTHTGDTTIGAYTYSQFRFTPVNMAQSPFYYWYNSGKVYRQYTLSSTPDTSSILYDFSLVTGDSINLPGSFMHNGWYNVDSVATVTILNAQPRKYLRLVGGPFNDTLEWIDGLGDINNGFFYYSDFEGGHHETVCISDSAGAMYSNPNTSFYCDPNDPIPGPGPNTCDQFSFNAQIVGTSCVGCDGYINITNLTGGSPGYTYAWSNGGTAPWVSGLCEGPITLTITDSVGTACARTFVVPENSVSVTITATDTNLCDGLVSICATAVGGSPPYTYYWTPGFIVGPCMTITVVATTVFTVIITDANGCTATQTVLVTTPPPMQVTEQVTYPGCSTCCDGNVNLNINGGTPVYTYSWTPTYPGAGNFCPGTYNYCVTDANGCSVCDTVVVLNPLGVAENLNGDFTVSPNPANDFIRVQRTTNEPTVVLIRDVSGKLIREYSLNSESFSMDIAAFAEGVYFVSIDGVTKRIIIARE